MPRDERQFGLPGIEELTKEQRNIRRLPAEGRFLVVGGPGTGKTVMCLLRSRRHAREGNHYLFLVWNHLLLRASNAMFGEPLDADTWKSWFWGQFRQFTGASVPTLDVNSGGFAPEDWDGVARMIEDMPDTSTQTPDLPRLVIDEGQDMPPGFYDALNQFGFEHVFVAADQNQQIKDAENSSREQLTDHVGGEVIELSYNHRNSYPIARLAREFHTDPASPPPDLPEAQDSLRLPRLYNVNDAMLPRIARSILGHWDQDPRRLIGVIAPNNRVRKRYLGALRSVLDDWRGDNGVPVIETFHGQRRPAVRFDRGGILVINAQACKGLEFDTVVLADIDEHRVDAADPDRTKKLFYVMVSRARERLVMFNKKSGNGVIDGLLPKGEDILRREDMTVESTRRGGQA